MPRSLEPGSRIVFVLDCDKDKIPQPRAFGRTLSISQTRKLMSAMDAMKAATTTDAKIECAVDAAMTVLAGWENMVDPVSQELIVFSREALECVYSIEELTEILNIAADDGRLSTDERKKSESHPLFAAANSVPVALAAAMGS